MLSNSVPKTSGYRANNRLADEVQKEAPQSVTPDSSGISEIALPDIKPPLGNIKQNVTKKTPPLQKDYLSQPTTNTQFYEFQDVFEWIIEFTFWVFIWVLKIAVSPLFLFQLFAIPLLFAYGTNIPYGLYFLAKFAGLNIPNRFYYFVQVYFYLNIFGRWLILNMQAVEAEEIFEEFFYLSICVVPVVLVLIWFFSPTYLYDSINMLCRIIMNRISLPA